MPNIFLGGTAAAAELDDGELPGGPADDTLALPEAPVDGELPGTPAD